MIPSKSHTIANFDCFDIGTNLCHNPNAFMSQNQIGVEIVQVSAAHARVCDFHNRLIPAEIISVIGRWDDFAKLGAFVHAKVDCHVCLRILGTVIVVKYSIARQFREIFSCINNSSERFRRGNSLYLAMPIGLFWSGEIQSDHVGRSSAVENT